MSVIRRLVPLLFVTATAGAAVAQVPHAANMTAILGRWEGLPTSTVGIGHVMEFTTNGVAVCTPGSLVEGTYRVNGADLTQAAATPPETVTVRLAFRRDTLIQYAANKLDSVRLVRRSGMSSASVVGSWRSRSPTGKESFVDYRQDGTFKLWVPFESEAGSFSVNGDTLMIAVEKGKLNGRYLWSMDGANLRLQPLAGAKSAPVVLARSAAK